MTPAEFILAVLGALPDRKVLGKKRLQKFGMLLQYAGLDFDAGFSLHRYGPYSSELADAADELSWSGKIKEKAEQTGMFGMFQTTYTLPDDHEPSEMLTEPHKEKLLRLIVFSTIELEVASTIALFQKEGLDPKGAIAKTCSLKRAKAIPPVLAKAEKILEIVS